MTLIAARAEPPLGILPRCRGGDVWRLPYSARTASFPEQFLVRIFRRAAGGPAHLEIRPPRIVRFPRAVAFIAHCAALIALFVCPLEASAHVPPVAGKLVDCIRQSDVIVVGVIERVTDVDSITVETTLRVERTFLGAVSGPTIPFRGGARFAAQERYVVFLRRSEQQLIGVQPAGTIFPSRASDDALYEQVILAVRAALACNDDVRIDCLRSALIPALRAAPEPLRYHAMLELGALVHHGTLSADQRRQLAAIAAEPDIDPRLRQMIALIRGE